MNEESALLDRLATLVDETCRRKAQTVQAESIETMLRELDAVFDAMTSRIADGTVPPMDILLASKKRLVEAEQATPPELRLRTTKFVLGAPRQRYWGEIAARFAWRLDQLRYDLLASRNTRNCDCLVLVELAATSRRPRSPRLRSIGWNYDGYYNGAAFECDECGTRWLHCTEDTESQHIEWWEPQDRAWQPARPPAG